MDKLIIKIVAFLTIGSMGLILTYDFRKFKAEPNEEFAEYFNKYGMTLGYIGFIILILIFVSIRAQFE